MTRKNTRRSGATVGKADRDPLKRFPNGLRALIKSVHKHWPEDLKVESKARTAAAFINGYLGGERYLDKYNEVSALYGAARKTTPGSLKRKLDKLEGNGGETRHINFIDIRALAEHVGGLPSGLLLIYSQCVSDDAHDRDLDKQIQFLNKCASGIEALKKYVEKVQTDNKNLSKNERPFIESVSANVYKAKLLGLDRLVKGYNDNPITSS